MRMSLNCRGASVNSFLNVVGKHDQLDEFACVNEKQRYHHGWRENFGFRGKLSQPHGLSGGAMQHNHCHTCHVDLHGQMNLDFKNLK